MKDNISHDTFECINDGEKYSIQQFLSKKDDFTVGQLKKILDLLPDDMKIVCYLGGEDNDTVPVSSFSTGYIFKRDDYWGELLFFEDIEADYCDGKEKNAEKVLVIHNDSLL